MSESTYFYLIALHEFSESQRVITDDLHPAKLDEVIEKLYSAKRTISVSNGSGQVIE